MKSPWIYTPSAGLLEAASGPNGITWGGGVGDDGVARRMEKEGMHVIFLCVNG